LINLGEISIISPKPLKLDRNPYLSEDREYFEKRRQKLINAKFRAAIYKKFEHQCPRCGESLHNGEQVDLHHIEPQKTGGKYSMKNIQPLHQICHQQVTYENRKSESLKN
jgi:RNA-directed DNA polymerase